MRYAMCVAGNEAFNGGETMINVNKLKGKIVERGLSVQDVAKAIGISTASLYRKMDPSGSTMYIHEAYEISRVLKLTLDEVNAIFFCRFSRIK